MVAGDVECFGDADEGVEAGCDFAGFVAADALAVGADEFAEVGLGPAVFGSECLIRSPRANGPGPVGRCNTRSSMSTNRRVWDLCEVIVESGGELLVLAELAVRFPSANLVTVVGIHVTRTQYGPSGPLSDAVRVLLEAAPDFGQGAAVKLMNLVGPIQVRARWVKDLGVEMQRGIVALIRAGLAGVLVEIDQAMQILDKSLAESTLEAIVGAEGDALIAAVAELGSDLSSGLYLTPNLRAAIANR